MSSISQSNSPHIFAGTVGLAFYSLTIPTGVVEDYFFLLLNLNKRLPVFVGLTRCPNVTETLSE